MELEHSRAGIQGRHAVRAPASSSTSGCRAWLPRPPRSCSAPAPPSSPTPPRPPPSTVPAPRRPHLLSPLPPPPPQQPRWSVAAAVRLAHRCRPPPPLLTTTPTPRQPPRRVPSRIARHVLRHRHVEPASPNGVQLPATAGGSAGREHEQHVRPRHRLRPGGERAVAHVIGRRETGAAAAEDGARGKHALGTVSSRK